MEYDFISGVSSDREFVSGEASGFVSSAGTDDVEPNENIHVASDEGSTYRADAGSVEDGSDGEPSDFDMEAEIAKIKETRRLKKIAQVEAQKVSVHTLH